MPIPDSQLQTWSNLGATQSSQNTYASIKNALNSSFKMSGSSYDVYLQGSYANTTNIRGDSDVDIVAELTTPEFSNPNPQSPHSTALNTWTAFRNSVIQALQNHYGTQAVIPKNRCVRVIGGGGRLPADVVVCLRYRHRNRSYSSKISESGLGITLLDLETRRWVNNFPKLHLANGSAKNEYSRTRNNYKPTIRMIKNARNKLIQLGKISESTAPSYFVECLLYNVPDLQFRGTLGERFKSTADWLYEQFRSHSTQGFTCQNQMSSLFGSDTTQWNPDDAERLVIGLQYLWLSY